MTLEGIWRTYCRDGFAALAEAELGDPQAHFYLALLAFAEQAFEAALDHARRAAQSAPDDPVFAQAVTYLRRVASQGKHGVYVSGDGFAAFVRGGGNVPLYQATSAALREVYEQYAALDLLDVGAGDGLALLPALAGSIRSLDILEPSGAMLTTASAALHARGVPHHAIEQTLQQFATEAWGQWDVVQATYSLQSVPTDERPAMLRWLRAHGRRLLVAEFDVPAFGADLGPERVRYVLEAYRRGMAEYVQDRDLVAQGFLMPVMFGYFDPTAARTNHEQPLQAWVAQLREAGFREVTPRLLFRYWWAPAYLLDAR
jgi:hypothetical protein